MNLKKLTALLGQPLLTRMKGPHVSSKERKDNAHRTKARSIQERAMEQKVKQITVVNHLTTGKGTQEGGERVSENCTPGSDQAKRVKYMTKVSNGA